MRPTDIELVLEYIDAQRQKYSESVREEHRRISNRDPDAMELLEYILLLERANTFEDFADTIAALLHLYQ